MRLPAEWEKQRFIQLTWPHKNSDWASMLDEVEPVFIHLAIEISQRQHLLIVCPHEITLRTQLSLTSANLNNIVFAEFPSNDTWARDHGAITILDDNNQPHLLDFGFNGWGLKFASNYDNQLSRKLVHYGFIQAPLHTISLILEGGGIESDGQGTLLSTTQCLLEANRNPHLTQKDIEEKLSSLLGIHHFLWLHHGYLAGDDTDSHIDTLARLAPYDTILYVSCDDETDEHYHELNAMKNELIHLRTPDNRPYRLLPLPMAKACFDEENNRLPATYANFLIINQAVLLPFYDDPINDQKAKNVLATAFPEHEIIGIECTPLIYQHGSLHCVTMQYPESVILTQSCSHE